SNFAESSLVSTGAAAIPKKLSLHEFSCFPSFSNSCFLSCSKSIPIMLCNVCGDILIEDDTPAQKADDDFQRFKGVLLRTWYDITALQASAEIEGCDLCAMVWDSVKSYSREYEPSKLPQWIV